MKTLRILAAVAGLATVTFTSSAPIHAQSKWTVVMRGLDNPRGLTFVEAGDGGGWALYVAEAGRASGNPGPCANVGGGVLCADTTGAVSRYRNGVQERIVTGLPSLVPVSGTPGFGTIGPNDVSFADGTGFVIIGLGQSMSPLQRRALFGQNLGWIMRFNDAGTAVLDTDVAAYEQTANPDGGPVGSNPLGLLAGAGRRIAVDLGGNSLLGVSPQMEISTIATFPSRAQGRLFDALPSSVALGPDGAFYVGEYTGVPNTANIYRVVPGQAPQVYCSGLSFIHDLDFDRFGNLYVLEGPFLDVGTLFRVGPSCNRVPVVTQLSDPSSVAIGPDGNAYISNFGNSPLRGEVIRVDLQAPPGVYELVASHSQKCLDVPEWSHNDGMPVVQWTCNGGDNQKWRVEATTDGYSRLIAQHSGKCLDVSAVSTEDRADIIQWQCHGGANQQWRVEAVAEGYQLVARHSGKCVDVRGESTNDGGSIIQWTCHSGANQTWVLRPVTTVSAPSPQAALSSSPQAVRSGAYSPPPPPPSHPLPASELAQSEPPSVITGTQLDAAWSVPDVRAL